MADKVKEIERRAFGVKGVEVRKSADGMGRTVIGGYGAVFYSLSDALGGFYERIQPGAFTKTLGEADVRALWNHDTNYVLGRVKAGTLRLSEDEQGLAFELDAPDTQVGRDLVVSMERGDVDQMSFGFWTVRDKWEQLGDQVVRTLIEVRLVDVSPVTFPAYSETSASVRSMFEEFQRQAHSKDSGQAAAPGQEAHPAAPMQETRPVDRLARLRKRVELEEVRFGGSGD